MDTTLSFDLNKSIEEFFKESKENVDSIFNEIGFVSNELQQSECDVFLRERDQLLNKFEHHLMASCSILKDLDDESNLNEVLKDKIQQFIDEEEQMNKEINELLTTKQKLRELLEMKSTTIKKSMEKKKELDQMYPNSVKDEFISLCKFMNLKFQWSQSEQKFTIVFLSSSSDVNQVKHIDAKKLLNNDEDYVKKLRDHFKLKLLEIIK